MDFFCNLRDFEKYGAFRAGQSDVIWFNANTLGVVVDFALEPKEGEGSQVQDVYFAVAHFPN